MTTHVFIVDSNTFKIHLEYLFVGTGAKGKKVDFNNVPETSLVAQAENPLVSMIADGSRIRCGDEIIFYLQQKGSSPGQFFGVFKAKNDCIFLDNNDEKQYLKDGLIKSLTFRAMIEPYKVYAKGVTEWEALDEIKNITSPNQMLWSLIYRKLKGNRGNTMITIYEAERLTQLIRNKNNRVGLNFQNKALSFDSSKQEIVSLNEEPKQYSGRQEKINLIPRLVRKYQKGNAFETHLQAYIAQNIGKEINRSLDNTILNGAEIEWLGNEVSCGVGMQRIDIMLSVIQNKQRVIIPMELKRVQAKIDNLRQIGRYIDWIEQYYLPNRQSDIQPVLLTREISNKRSNKYQQLVDNFYSFNEKNKNRCSRLKYIEFKLDESSDLSFNEVLY